MLIDHHIHTAPFSFDGWQTPVELLQAAKRNNLDGFCVTDHYEKDVRYIGAKEAIFDTDQYYFTIRQLKEAGKSAGLFVLYGIELGYLPHLAEAFRRLVNRYPFDAVILSVHILDGEDPYVDEEIYHRGKKKLYDRYFEQLAEMIYDGPDFDILGHFDYICRYAPWPDRKIFFKEHADQLDALLEVLVKNDKTLEINTATVAKLVQSGYPLSQAWPDNTLIRRYLERGGSKICLSSDAHDSASVGRYLADGIQWLRSLGVRQVTHYNCRHADMTLL